MSVQRPATEALPGPRQSFGPYRVCLVCLGNICRSPMAETVLRAELDAAGLDGKAVVDSAGTGDWHIGDRIRLFGEVGGLSGADRGGRDIPDPWGGGPAGSSR